MSVSIGFDILFMGCLLLYMVFRFRRKKDWTTLLALILQGSVLTTALLSFFNDVDIGGMVEFFYILLGILLPGGFVFYDYQGHKQREKLHAMLDGREHGGGRKEKENLSTPQTKGIHPILEEMRVPELMEDIQLAPEVCKNVKRTLVKAQGHIKKQEYMAAYEIYTTILEIVKKSPFLYYNYGNMCYNVGKYAEAAKHYQRVLEVDARMEGAREVPSNPQEVGNYGTGERRRKQILLRSRYNLGNAYYAQGRLEDAVRCYKEALELDPGLVQANENMAYGLLGLERRKEAIACYQRLIENDPKDYLLRYKIGVLYMEEADYEKAVEELKQCIAFNRRFEKGYQLLGETYLKAGRFEEAAAILKQRIALKPVDGRAYYHLGVALYFTGLKKEAIQYYRKAIERNPEDSESYYHLAIVLEDTNDHKEAMGALEQAIQIKPDYIHAYLALGDLLAARGDFLNAVETYKKGLDYNPKEYELYYHLGSVLSEMRRYPEALDAFKRALDIRPDAYDGLIHMGKVLKKLHHYEEAEGLYKRALKLRPNESHLYYHLSGLYALMRKSDAALKYLEESIHRDQELQADALRNVDFQSIRRLDRFKKLVS